MKPIRLPARATLAAILLAAAALPAARPAAAQSQIAQAQTTLDQAAIRVRLKQQFERPGAPLTVAPIVVHGNYAVAGWSQSGQGGRVLLRRRHGKWEPMICSGDPLKQAATLAHHGVPAADAAVIVRRLAAAERSLPPGRLRQFSAFRGTVVLGKDGHHPPHGAGHH